MNKDELEIQLLQTSETLLEWKREAMFLRGALEKIIQNHADLPLSGRANCLKIATEALRAVRML